MKIFNRKENNENKKKDCFLCGNEQSDKLCKKYMKEVWKDGPKSRSHFDELKFGGYWRP